MAYQWRINISIISVMTQYRKWRNNIENNGVISAQYRKRNNENMAMAINIRQWPQ
jgi:hypothetical protein